MKRAVIFKRAFTFGLFLLLIQFIQIPGINFPGFVLNVEAAATGTLGVPSNDIQLNVTKKSLVKETTYDLKVYNLTDEQKVSFKSSDSSIVSVSDDGIVTANKIGTATITVTVKESFKSITNLYCEITVGPPAVSVKFTKPKVELQVGRKTALKITLKPITTAEEAKFSSSDTKIATVSSSGKVTGKSVGQTTIYATINDNKYDICTVTVTESSSESDNKDVVSNTK